MKNRRIGPDIIVRTISRISVVIWIVFIAVFVLFAIANPTHSGLAASRPSLTGNAVWIERVVYGLLVIQVMLGAAGIFFNVTRLKRKTDRLKLTPVISVVLGVLWLLVISLK